MQKSYLSVPETPQCGHVMSIGRSVDVTSIVPPHFRHLISFGFVFSTSGAGGGVVVCV